MQLELVKVLFRDVNTSSAVRVLFDQDMMVRDLIGVG